MLHFPSSAYHAPSPNSKAVLPSRTDSLKLNATQQKAATHQIFTTVEEELHDARRVHSHGQEEDLRAALGMVVERLGEVSTMLSDAYKTSADLEVQLNVAKSNLALVIANNEMLEDALKQRDSTTQNTVGWRRTSGRAYSTDDALQAVSPHPDNIPTATPVDSPAQESTRFFKFRFTPGSSATRPSSPAIPPAHLNSPSMPALGVVKEKKEEREKELERELEKEKKAREDAKKEKEALEEELESLSQALFEEANKMVATERIRRADVEEELREAKLEKEALRSALRLLEGQASSTSSPAIPSTESTLPSSLSISSLRLSQSPTSISDPAIPYSISPNATRRLQVPPPAPLSVPTTPFDYDASFDTTPRQEESMQAPPSPASTPASAVGEPGKEPESKLVSESEETKMGCVDVEAELLLVSPPLFMKTEEEKDAVLKEAIVETTQPTEGIFASTKSVDDFVAPTMSETLTEPPKPSKLSEDTDTAPPVPRAALKAPSESQEAGNETAPTITSNAEPEKEVEKQESSQQEREAQQEEAQKGEDAHKGEETQKEDVKEKETQQQQSSLHLFPHEHDPWADAVPSRE
ncbi:hypothetical protein H0H87_004911 [Tephrocybe sp. NHM501043]|nr:hypothetical protein H0H87_004911 [Tephrocybe sp. NHM501043]